jgi:hypothetical protein
MVAKEQGRRDQRHVAAPREIGTELPDQPRRHHDPIACPGAFKNDSAMFLKADRVVVLDLDVLAQHAQAVCESLGLAVEQQQPFLAYVLPASMDRARLG